MRLKSPLRVHYENIQRSMAMADVIDYQIYGDDLQLVEVELDQAVVQA